MHFAVWTFMQLRVRVRIRVSDHSEAAIQKGRRPNPNEGLTLTPTLCNSKDLTDNIHVE